MDVYVDVAKVVYWFVASRCGVICLLRLYTVMVRLDWLAGIVKYKTVVRKAVVVVEVVVLVVLVYTSLLSSTSIYDRNEVDSRV
jgi:hypothetical protein